MQNVLKKKFNILILGGTKFIGKSLINNLDSEFEIDVLSRRKIKHNKIKSFYKTDLENYNKFLLNKKYDFIVDLISKDKNLLKNILIKLNYKKYIYISTAWLNKLNTKSSLDNIIISKNKRLIKNELTQNYLNNKNKIEHFLIRFSKKLKNKKIYIIRFPIVLGDDDKTKRLNFFYRKILDNKNILIIKDKKVEINFVWVEDLSKALVLMLKKKNWGKSQIFETLNFKKISYIDFIKTLCKKIKKKNINFIQVKKRYLRKNFYNFFLYDPFINEVNLKLTNNNLFKITKLKPMPFDFFIKKIKINKSIDKSQKNKIALENNFINKKLL